MNQKVVIYAAIAVGIVVVGAILVFPRKNEDPKTTQTRLEKVARVPSRLVVATCHHSQDVPSAALDIFDNADSPESITLSLVAVVPDGTSCPRMQVALEKDIAKVVGREREEGQVKIRCVAVSNFRGALQTFLKVLEEDYQKQDQVALYDDLPSLRMNIGWDTHCWGRAVRTCGALPGSRSLGFLGWDSEMGQRVYAREGPGEEVPSLGVTLRAVSGGPTLLRALALAKRLLSRGTVLHGDAVLSACLWKLGIPATCPPKPWCVARSKHVSPLPGTLTAIAEGRHSTRRILSGMADVLRRQGIGTRDAELGLTAGVSSSELISKWGSRGRYREMSV